MMSFAAALETDARDEIRSGLGLEMLHQLEQGELALPRTT